MLLEYVPQEGLEGEWKDVMEIITNHLEAGGQADDGHSTPLRSCLCGPGCRRMRSIYGEPDAPHRLYYCAPTTENGVIFAYLARVAERLGVFHSIAIQTAFPDCEALQSRWGQTAGYRRRLSLKTKAAIF